MRLALARDLVALRAAALARLDAAHARRRAVIDANPGVHLAKLIEADRVLAGGTSPLVADAAEAAAIRGKWDAAAAALAADEAERQAAQAAIRTAVSAAAIEAAVAAAET